MKRTLIYIGPLVGILAVISTFFAFSSSSQPAVPAPSLIKSVRVDLSSMDVPADQGAFITTMLNQLTSAHANTVYLSPWADGAANYTSATAPESDWGKEAFVEKFIMAAHNQSIKVFGWFVVAKDDFPATIHPEWYAHTANGQPYNQEDSPGIFLPFANLANQSYINYHLKLMTEIAGLPFDGYVISEPVISWEENGNQQPLSGTEKSQIVTSFVAETMQALRPASKPIVITVYNEPLANGELKSNQEIKDWLGLDLDALVALKPDYIEAQDLFNDFEFQQPPAWTTSFIQQYRARLPANVPLLVSIQGYDGDHGALPDADFITAMQTAMQSGVAGVSFYAYNTTSTNRWQLLSEIWK